MFRGYVLRTTPITHQHLQVLYYNYSSGAILVRYSTKQLFNPLRQCLKCLRSHISPSWELREVVYHAGDEGRGNVDTIIFTCSRRAPPSPNRRSIPPRIVDVAGKRRSTLRNTHLDLFELVFKGLRTLHTLLLRHQESIVILQVLLSIFWYNRWTWICFNAVWRQKLVHSWDPQEWISRYSSELCWNQYQVHIMTLIS